MTGEEVLITYTLPMLPKGVLEEKLIVLPTGHVGGAEGTRTPYLFNAIESLSQMSYSPTSNNFTRITTKRASPAENNMF